MWPQAGKRQPFILVCTRVPLEKLYNSGTQWPALDPSKHHPNTPQTMHVKGGITRLQSPVKANPTPWSKPLHSSSSPGKSSLHSQTAWGAIPPSDVPTAIKTHTRRHTKPTLETPLENQAQVTREIVPQHSTECLLCKATLLRLGDVSALLTPEKRTQGVKQNEKTNVCPMKEQNKNPEK